MHTRDNVTMQYIAMCMLACYVKTLNLSHCCSNRTVKIILPHVDECGGFFVFCFKYIIIDSRKPSVLASHVTMSMVYMYGSKAESFSICIYLIQGQSELADMKCAFLLHFLLSLTTSSSSTRYIGQATCIP